MNYQRLWRQHAGPTALGLFLFGALTGYYIGRSELSRPAEPVEVASAISLPERALAPAPARKTRHKKKAAPKPSRVSPEAQRPPRNFVE